MSDSKEINVAVYKCLACDGEIFFEYKEAKDLGNTFLNVQTSHYNKNHPEKITDVR